MNFGTATSVQANELLVFNITNCVNPSTTEPSSTFGFTIANSNNYTINTFTGTITLTTAESAQLLSPSLVSSSKVALTNINIEFKFTLAHSFPSAGIIYIYYPASVGYNSSLLGCQCIDFTSGSTSTCTCEQQTVNAKNRIIFRNTFPSGLAAGKVVKITLAGLINPSSANTTNSFEIYTETAETGGYKIDKATTGLTLKADCDYPCLT